MFVSRGYFASVNCLREVVAAIDLKKPRIVVHEADTLKGGAGLEELRMELTDVSHRNAIFSDDKSVIRWFRLADFQVQSLLLIVQQMLTSSPTYRNKAEPLKLYIPGSILDKPLVFRHPVVLYASRHNPGAAEAAEEMRVMYNQVSWIDAPPPSLQEVQTNPLVSLAALGRKMSRKMSIENLGGKRLSISESSQSSKLPTARRSDLEAVTPSSWRRVSGAQTSRGHADAAAPSASHFLLYLNRHTFGRHTHDGSAGALLAQEIRNAWDAKFKIVLLHEKDPARGGCEFKTFFLTSPQNLIEDGLYRQQLATPFEGDEAHRKVSRALYAKALGAVMETSQSASMQRAAAGLRKSATQSLQLSPSRK